MAPPLGTRANLAGLRYPYISDNNRFTPVEMSGERLVPQCRFIVA